MWNLGASSCEQASEPQGFGHSLACGDFDADGIDDLAVGSPTRGPIDQVFERQAGNALGHRGGKCGAGLCTNVDASMLPPGSGLFWAS